MLDDRLDVVIVDGSIAVTGGLRSATRIARLLRPSARTTLVLPSNSQIPPEELREFEAVVHLPMIYLRRSFKAIMTYLPGNIIGDVRLAVLLRRTRTSRLIINDFTTIHASVARVLGYRGRIVTYVRFDPARFPTYLAKAWLGTALRTSQSVVAVSNFIRGRLPPSPKVTRVYDPVDDRLVRDRLSDDRSGSDIVCLGNYIPGKGQDHAIEAFRLVADEVPLCRLRFYGGDMGQEKNRRFRQSLEERAVQYGLAGRIMFHDFVADPAAAFAGALVALNLSESESFSYTCLEAAQLRLPVVAFRSGGPEEIIEDGKTGYLCALGDISGVAEALRELLFNPAKASCMGQEAEARVTRKFSQKAYIKHLRSELEV